MPVGDPDATFFERFHAVHASLLGLHLKPEGDGLTDVFQGLIAALPLRMAPGQIKTAHGVAQPL